jgi:hypothetical protein
MTTTPPRREKSLGTLSPTDVPLEALPVVELTEQEIKHSLRTAKRRNDSYIGYADKDVFGDLDSLDSHQIGILGELAVAKFYALDIDTEVYDYGDGGRDFSLFDRLDVDVKTTATDKMRLPELLVKANKEVTADQFIRAHIISRDNSRVYVRLLGYVPEEIVTDREPRRHPGQTKNYVVGPNEMTMLPYFNIIPDG